MSKLTKLRIGKGKKENGQVVNLVERNRKVDCFKPTEQLV